LVFSWFCCESSLRMHYSEGALRFS
jgi:hypothetical protein